MLNHQSLLYPLSSLSILKLSPPTSSSLETQPYNLFIKKFATLPLRNKHQIAEVQDLAQEPMLEDIQWFYQQNLYEFILKTVINVFVLLFALLFNFIGFQTFVICTVFVFFCYGIIHNYFDDGIQHKWAIGSIIFSAFLLTHQILTTTCDLFNYKFYTNNSMSILSMTPSFIVLGMLLAVYFLRGVIIQNQQIEIKNALFVYAKNIKQSLRNLVSIKMQLLKIYSILFLFSYALISFLQFDDILIHSSHYKMLLSPYVFFSQIAAFLWVFLFYCSVLCFSKSLSKSMCLTFYSKMNKFTQLPLILQLLQNNSNKKAFEQTQTKRIFKIFSMERQKQFNLKQNGQQKIYKCAMTWILNFIKAKNQSINHKISIYNNYKAKNIEQIDIQMSYLNLLESFLFQQLNRYSQKLQIVKNNAESFCKESEKQRSLFQIIIQSPKVLQKQFKFWASVYRFSKYFETTSMIFSFLSVTHKDLIRSCGKSQQILEQMQQIKNISNKTGSLQWLNELIMKQLIKTVNKTHRILQKAKQ